MSRSRNEHKKTYNFPLRHAKAAAKKSIHVQSARILADMKKAIDPDSVNDKVYEKDRSVRGDILWFD